MFVRAYLRASTEEQDATRARSALQQFTADQGISIAAWYIENESGASLKRPELFRLLSDCQSGDVLLVEQVDRLSRLNDTDWEALKREIGTRGVRVVALDLPTSWRGVSVVDETMDRILAAVNSMLLDMLAAIARKDYTDRRRRQAEGIINAKDSGLYKGRRENIARNGVILEMIKKRMTWNDIQKATGCSRSTISETVN